MIQEIYTLPEYWASALINADYSGLTDSEEQEINTFIDDHKTAGCVFWCIDADFETKGFRWSNDATNLGCDCIDYTFDVSPI